MKIRTIILSVMLFFVAGAMCLAADNPQMGTWKLNQAKVTVEGVDAEGKPTHNEWTGKFDSKDYPVTGDPTSDTRSYKQIDDHTLELTVKKDGKATVTGKVVVSADGKSRTVSTSGTDAKGGKVKNT